MCQPQSSVQGYCAHLKMLLNLRLPLTGTCHLTFDGHTAPVKSVQWINVGKLHQNGYLELFLIECGK